MKIRNKKFPEGTLSVGSALILAVVLTSLLAIVGVLFVMVARVDKIATSAISENRELNWAVETVVAQISQELVRDVPGNDPCLLYYDYPDADNAWLASLEPEVDNNGTPANISDDVYYWPHLTDLYRELDANAWGLQAEIIPDYQYDVNEDLPADADGDGVADSRWIELEHITSSEGKPIFAAVRIVDNGGMLNVNTAYKFDPCELLPYEILRKRMDGSSQMQINLAALSQRGRNGTLAEAAQKLQAWRCGTGNPLLYEQNVVWRYSSPTGGYTPFDISDELELKNRFLLNQQDTYTRIEQIDWTRAFLTSTTLDVPRNERDHSLSDPNHWFWKANNSSWDANQYDYRHVATTYNMDRIIRPDGGKMVNVNRINPVAEPNVSDLYGAIWRGLYDAGIDNNSLTAQIAANIKDFADNDSNVTTVYDLYGNPHYGFEQPCVYISELAHKFVLVDPNDPNTAYRSYAIELYKPYFEDNDPCDWQLVINNPPREIDVDWSGTEQFDVRYWEDANKIAMLVVDFNDSNCCDPCDPDCDPCDCDMAKAAMYENPIDWEIFVGGSVIELQRFVADVNYHIVVDSMVVPDANATTGWLQPDVGTRSIQRDITLHKCIRRLWGPNSLPPSLGHSNSYPPYPDPDPSMIQAHPVNKGFTNIGEIGMVFRNSAYNVPIGITEPDIRLNLADPVFQQIFNYLTVFDPSRDGINNDGDRITGVGEIIDEDALNQTPEWKIPGRININTAPWYVIAQLPWVSQRYGYNSGALAQAIVAYRDRTFVPGGPDYQGRPGEPGFGSIGELNRVVDPLLNPDYSIDYYKWVVADQAGPPDLTPEDGAVNDFEERDLIFARISNLVTVRSDVFTAYILVRIGVDGPQKRAVAILDRSNVYSVDGKVKIVALHPVPDPR